MTFYVSTPGAIDILVFFYKLSVTDHYLRIWGLHDQPTSETITLTVCNIQHHEHFLTSIVSDTTLHGKIFYMFIQLI